MHCFFFFFNDTATTEIYTLSLHDALPIWPRRQRRHAEGRDRGAGPGGLELRRPQGARGGRQGEDRAVRRPLRQLRRDRKSTRLNSSHTVISYAVFCLKKKHITIRSEYYAR